MILAPLPVDLPDTVHDHHAGCPACSRRWREALDIDCVNQMRPADPGDSCLVYASMLSPLGLHWIAAEGERVLALDTWTDEAEFCARLERVAGPARYDPPAMQPIVRRIAGYFQGERLDLPVDMRLMRPFQQRVLAAVANVPYGQTRTYGDIARAVEKPGAARAVGTAVATNPISLIVPCHRVVRSDGTTGEYALHSIGRCGVVYKELLLALERGV